MLRKILATIAVTAALIAGALAPAGPAQAAYSDCNNGHVCLFMGIGGSGNLYQWTGVYLYDRGGLTLAGEINNGSTSWRNRPLVATSPQNSATISAVPPSIEASMRK